MAKMLSLALCALSVAPLVPAASAVTTVYDNMDASGTLMSGGGSFGIFKTQVYEQALQFEPTQTVRLTDFQIPISKLVSGLSIGSATVQLRLDAGNLPGAVVESWTTPSISLLTPAFHDFDSAVGATLAAGQKYWISIAKSDGGSLGGMWYFSGLAKRDIDGDGDLEDNSALEALKTNAGAWNLIESGTEMHRRAYALHVNGQQVMPGDANEDGRISRDDFALLDRGVYFNRRGWNNGDFNGDAVVNLADRAILDAAFIQQQQSSVQTALAGLSAEYGPAYAAQVAALVPEPGTALVAAASATLLVARRRRA